MAQWNYGRRPVYLAGVYPCEVSDEEHREVTQFIIHNAAFVELRSLEAVQHCTVVLDFRTDAVKASELWKIARAESLVHATLLCASQRKVFAICDEWYAGLKARRKAADAIE